MEVKDGPGFKVSLVVPLKQKNKVLSEQIIVLWLFISLFFLFRPLWDPFFCILSTLGSFIPFLTIGATLYKNINTVYLLTTLNQT